MVNPDRNLYEPPYDDALLYDTDLEPERPRSRPLVVMLGFVVLAAFAGVVWVAYNQGIKQGQSGLPVLTADAGPTRIVPDAATSAPAIDPAPEKDYARLEGSTPDNSQVNMLPGPEQPKTAPSPQDVTVTPAQPQPAPATPGETGIGGAYGRKATDFQEPGFAPGMDSTVGNVAATKKAPAASEDITASLPTQPAKAPTTNLAPAKPIQPPKAVTPPAPAPEPAPAPLAAPPVDAAPPAEAPKDTGPMIQLGSFPNAKDAADAWSKIKSANQALLAEHSPAIRPAEIPGKGTWFRLRVGGFADKAAAQAACQQLTASGQPCILAAK